MKLNEYIIDKFQLFNFLKEKTGFKPGDILFTAVIGGLANTMILVALATAVYNLTNNNVEIRLFLTFILLLILMVVSQRKLYYRWLEKMETAVQNTRNELCEKLTSADLKTVENIDKGEVYNRLTQELSNISKFAVYLVKGMQAIFIVLFTGLYILQIFAPALPVIGGLLIIGALIYLAMVKKIYSKYEEINLSEINYFNWLSDVLYGKKEIKLNSKRRVNILSAGDIISKKLKTGKLIIGSHYNMSVVFTSAFFYFLFGAVVFLLPLMFDISKGTILILSAVTIYLTEPISNIVSVVPLFQKVALSISFIGQLEATLNDAAENGGDGDNKQKTFDKVEIKNVKYRYNIDNNEFILGPLSEEINNGEITFITGGNGCGKTTLVKIISSLYRPEEGDILIDGESIFQNIDVYRNMYACIFSDFHLFEKVYGLDESLIPLVNEKLEQFNLQHKTYVKGRSFSTLELSTGQKKRLAMAVALTEDKDIYLFDEWAAEQDPGYRDYFYYELLSDLKKRGKTVIAVSHDERYFKVADKIIRMDLGKIVPVKT